MSRAKNDEVRIDTNNEPKSYWTFVALCIVLALIGIAMAIGIVRYKKDPKSALHNPQPAQLDSLHVFPAIDFADSLCQKKVMTTYDDDSPCDVVYYEIDSAGNPTQNKVHETHYYPDHKEYFGGNVRNNNRDGLWYAYHPNGNVQTMAHYVDGKEEGRYTVYHLNGAVYYTGQYRQGKRVGTWSFYDENEILVDTKDYGE